uniref:40S ribosomal protein S19G n=3 Tax=Ascaris suum TaxID=6253 RepID=F1L980_ASCSU
MVFIQSWRTVVDLPELGVDMDTVGGVRMVKATSVKDVDQHEIVQHIAKFLKKSGKVKVPEWSDVTKMGISKELAPLNSDWYYVRTASIARRLYVRSPTGGRFSFGVSVLFLR